jgi:hypothetical protein
LINLAGFGFSGACDQDLQTFLTASPASSLFRSPASAACAYSQSSVSGPSPPLENRFPSAPSLMKNENPGYWTLVQFPLLSRSQIPKTQRFGHEMQPGPKHPATLRVERRAQVHDVRIVDSFQGLQQTTDTVEVV